MKKPSVTVPEFICDKKKISEINNSDKITKNDKCFIDELMHVPNEYFQQFDGSYYAVGTIGPYHADIVQKTIPFNESMYKKNLKEFENIFTSFTGYRPSYLILLGIDDIDDQAVDDWKKQYSDMFKDNHDTYRKEITIIPDWKM